jgi:FkbM family methyltransferase
VLTRLVNPGDTVVDAGANVGYMTVLASVLAGPEGSVIAFEPHPGLFAVLQQNVAEARERFQIGPVDLHNDAVGERSGRAQLLLPPDFGTNDGIARIAGTPDEDGGTISVPVVTLDSALGEQRPAILKLDVEGFELQALRGAACALRTGRIRHIVFEDHQIHGSAVAALLRELGFSLFSVGWSNSGIEVVALDNRALAKQYEAPSFVASIDPDDVTRRCAPRGFRALNTLARSRRLG